MGYKMTTREQRKQEKLIAAENKLQRNIKLKEVDDNIPTLNTYIKPMVLLFNRHNHLPNAENLKTSNDTDDVDNIGEQVIATLTKLPKSSLKLLNDLYTINLKNVNPHFTYEKIAHLSEGLGAHIKKGAHKKFEFKDFIKPEFSHPYILVEHSTIHKHEALHVACVTRFKDFIKEKLGITEELIKITEKRILKKNKSQPKPY